VRLRIRGGCPACRWLLVLAALCSGLGAADSQGPESSNTRLNWSSESAAIAHWEVRPRSEDAAWQSLVSLDSSGNPLSRHFEVGLGSARWTPVVADDRDLHSTTRSYESDDGETLLELSIEPAAQTNRWLLTISLESRSETARTDESLAVQLGPGLGEEPMEGMGIATTLYSYVDPVVRVGGSVFTPDLDSEEPLTSLDLNNWQEGDWVGLNSRYFALLLESRSGTEPSRLSVGLDDANIPGGPPARYLPWLRLHLPVPELTADEPVKWQFEVYAGPKSLVGLRADGDDSYSELLFHSLWNWMRGLALGLLWLLEVLYALIPSWGLAICLLAVLVRVMLHPLVRWALISQQRFADVQRVIQPQIVQIKRQYKGEEQSERILELYESRGVSPLAGLKPLLIVLIQVPIFIAMFHVLGQAYELRDASFLWIDSLAEPDQLFRFGIDLPFFGAWFNILPVLMAVTTLLTIKLSPAPAATAADRRRQNLFLGFLAVAFFLLFYPFPSGMVLYWTVANILHIAQARLFRQRADSGSSEESAGRHGDA